MKIQQITFDQYNIFDMLKTLWASKFVNESNPFDNNDLWDIFVDLYGERDLFQKVINLLDDTKLDTIKCTYVSKQLMNMHSYSWKHLYNIYLAEYNPIENYNKIEVVVDNTVATGSGTSTSTNKIRPYDEINVPDKEFVNNTQNVSGASNSSSTTFSHKNNTSGNIGVTSQQMIQSEIDLWNKNMNIYDMIFKDIANYLGIGVK